MDWPTAGVIITAILGTAAAIVTALIKLVPPKMSDNPIELTPAQEQRFEHRLHQLQQDVDVVEGDVRELKTHYQHTSNEIADIKRKQDKIHEEIASLRKWLTEHWKP